MLNFGSHVLRRVQQRWEASGQDKGGRGESGIYIGQETAKKLGLIGFERKSGEGTYQY